MEKIQELTEKIYREGVEKGQAEVKVLTDKAKAEAEQIVADAKEKAAQIEADARRAAKELDTNTKAELKLYAGQAINALKSEIITMVGDKIVAQAVKATTDNKEFLAKFLVAIASNWADNQPLVIQSADADALKAYFASKAKDLLDKGLKIEKVNGKEALFTLMPADGSYKVNFGNEEFEAYFKEFLRPALNEMLF